MALGVLDHLSRDEDVCSVPPRRIRSVVFHQAAMEPDRAMVLVQVAALLDMSPQTAMAGLLADLPDERTLMPLSAPVAPADLALACNATVIASLLARALRVRIVARGQVRAVVRHVRLMGLLCHATPGKTKDEVIWRKVSMLKAARIERLIVCIDEERCCAEDPLEIDACVVRYRRKVDPRAVLEIVDPAVLKELPPPPQKRKASK